MFRLCRILIHRISGLGYGPVLGFTSGPSGSGREK